MRKSVKNRLILILAAFMLLSCGFGTFAASSAAQAGLGGLSVEDGYSLTPLNSAGEAISPEAGVYPKTEKLSLSFDSTAGVQYVAFVLYESNVPTADSIRYINQQEGSGGKLEFVLYPDSLEAEGAYCVYVSSAEGYIKAAEFEMSPPDYIKGDVDGNGSVDVGDATRLLRYLAQLCGENETVSTEAADTNGDGAVDVGDVTKLLRVLARIETM